MSFWDSKEPRCHGLRLFGNLGVYQGIVSSFSLLCLGGWEQETGCIMLILMLAVSSVWIMRKAIVTSSLLAVGHPSYGQRWNPGFGSARVWPPLVVLFKALISGGENVVARMKRVSLSIVVYLIWEERNQRVSENSCTLVKYVFFFFYRFQVLFYMILHFHEHNHPQIYVS